MSFLGLLTTAIPSVTALAIAFYAYPWQKEKDREHKIDEERRRALADLINVIEDTMGNVKAASPVAVPTVPDISSERLAVQKALSLVRAYGCASVVERTIEYDRAINKYRRCMENEKTIRIKRMEEIPEGKKFTRGKEYTEAQKRSTEAYKKMIAVRLDFFEELSRTLGVTVSSAELPIEEGDEDTK